MIYIGIDPGKKGGIAAIDPAAEVLLLVPMPVLTSGKARAQYDLPRIFERLVRQGHARVTIERLGAMPPGMGGSAANYQRGFSMGMLQAFCVALKAPYQLVSPSVWQKAFWKRKADTKQASVMEVQRLFPDVSLLPTERSRKLHDGMADALLIAEYGRRHANGLLT